VFIAVGSTALRNFFAEYGNLCPNLNHLHLIQVRLSNVPIGALPTSLESLAVTESLLPCNWFQPLAESGTAIAPRLRELDLSRSTDADVGHIARAWPELRVLKLNHYCHITAEDLQSIAEGLRQLEVLEICGTPCNDVAVHHICRNLAATLRRLRVAGCPQFTDGCAGTVAVTLTNLQSLDVSKCSRLSNDGLLAFAQLNKTLRYLDVSSTAISRDTLAQLTSLLPACNVVYEA